MRSIARETAGAGPDGGVRRRGPRVRALAVLLAASLVTTAAAAPRGKRRPTSTTGSTAAQPGGACHPGHHVLTYHGGDLVTHVAVFVLFWGPEWQTDPEHQASAGALRALFQKLSASPYGCSWQEWELPGKPIGAGSYLGDEIIPTDPVPAGLQLSDADIQARVVTEVNAQRAPAATDDTFYVVVPPKGVPVLAGTETGCGGTNFVFCGYHDSFTNAGTRFRYAVLPYPCSQGGGTCFVDAQQDPGRALEAVGSHELAETVTDPDSPPVANGGWFDDRSGFENADLCESDACLADLTVGPDTFTVNSLWSNLAKGCVASAPCAPPPVECTDPAPGICVANTKAPEGCAFEWLIDPNLTIDQTGLPDETVSCADGQPFCDADGSPNGVCTFRVAVCLNSVDPRLTCTPSSVSGVQLSRKLANSTDPTDRTNATALLNALAGIDPGSSGSVSGGSVSFTPAVATHNACSGYIDVVVPVRTRGSGVGMGTRVLGLAAQTAVGSVKESLKLLCQPTFP
jgi:hypothetical protein